MDSIGDKLPFVYTELTNDTLDAPPHACRTIIPRSAATLCSTPQKTRGEQHVDPAAPLAKAKSRTREKRQG